MRHNLIYIGLVFFIQTAIAEGSVNDTTVLFSLKVAEITILETTKNVVQLVNVHRGVRAIASGKFSKGIHH